MKDAIQVSCTLRCRYFLQLFDAGATQVPVGAGLALVDSNVHSQEKQAQQLVQVVGYIRLAATGLVMPVTEEQKVALNKLITSAVPRGCVISALTEALWNDMKAILGPEGYRLFKEGLHPRSRAATVAPTAK